jgi:perosamine synthetase
MPLGEGLGYMDRGEPIPVSQPFMWGNEIEYVSNALRTGWISSKGKYLDAFEKCLASYLSREHSLAVTSGTTALQLAFEAIDLQPGDEVIVPSFTMMSPIFAILRSGAVPIPVDADETWNLDYRKIEELISKKTKAILVVHTYGCPARADLIVNLAKKYNLYVIEDAAEALGAELIGRRIGSFGDVSCLSFYANKAVTTGEGGMLLTDNPSIFQKAAWKRNMCFGKDLENQYTHGELGHNFRMACADGESREGDRAQDSDREQIFRAFSSRSNYFAARVCSCNECVLGIRYIARADKRKLSFAASTETCVCRY